MASTRFLWTAPAHPHQHALVQSTQESYKKDNYYRCGGRCRAVVVGEPGGSARSATVKTK